MFDNWSGDVTGSSSTITFTADAEMTVIANFHKLTVDEVVDSLFGAPPNFGPDGSPALPAEEVIDSLFK